MLFSQRRNIFYQDISCSDCHLQIFSDVPTPVMTEATQAYTLDTGEELPKPEMVESTQPYCMMEEDSTPPLDEGESGDKEEGDTTPPIEDVLAATQAYSLDEQVH